MLYNRTPTQLYSDWQAEIEAGLEAGQTPVIKLGAGTLLLGALPTLVALQYLVERRTDVTTPTLFVGGVDPLWTAALTQAVSRPVGRGSPLPTVVFGGADIVTYMASLPTLKLEQPSSPLRSTSATPVNMTPLFIPAAQASPLAPWAALPFTLVESIDNGQRTNALRQADDWVTWLGIGISVALILLSLLT